MSRRDLPPDCQRSLDFSAVIKTLRLLEGEDVCLFISTIGADGKSSRIQAIGALTHYHYNWAEGFAIGEGTRVLIWEPDFVSATLRTDDGTNIFHIVVKLRGLDFVIGDAVVVQTDEFDLFP
jgi:hypothetical protein